MRGRLSESTDKLNFPEMDPTSGLLQMVSEADARRVTCVHASTCGGCPLIDRSYGDQLTEKRHRVMHATTRYPSLEILFTEPVAPAEPITAYRTRAKLIVAADGRIGLFSRFGDHEVVDIPHCLVLSPVVKAVVDKMRAILTENRGTDSALAPAGAASDEASGGLRAIDVREVRDHKGNASALLTLVTGGLEKEAHAKLRQAAEALLQQIPEVIGIAANFQDRRSPQILGPRTELLAGAAFAKDAIGHSTHHATFGSFVQAHRGQTSRVHDLLAEAIDLEAREDEKPTVLDLYGGSGAIALGLAKAGAHVHLVESFAPAVEQAKAAANEQNLSLTAEAADVTHALRALAESKKTYDAIVVNPPRRGISAVARDLLGRISTPKLVYVSCDPDTLTRDLDHLSRLGYVAARLSPLDMIPLSEEIETVAILTRAAPAPPKVVYEDEEIIIVEKAAHEPCTPKGEYVSSVVARLQRIKGASRAVPLHRLDIGTSGLLVCAKDPNAAPKWTAILSSPSTRRIYLAGVRGITPAKGAITRDLKENGKPLPARTRFRRLAITGGHSVLRVIPEEGRTHQIRRHLASIGHPVLGDEKYGHAATNRFFEEKNALDRTFLHCVRIEMDHPDRKERIVVEGALPGDLRCVLERTSGEATLKFLDHKNALGTSGFSSIPPDSSTIELEDRVPLSKRSSSPPSSSSPPGLD